MSDDLVSFEPHLPDRFGDQAERHPESFALGLDELRTWNAALKSQRDHLNACVIRLQDELKTEVRGAAHLLASRNAYSVEVGELKSRLEEYRREVERRDEMLAASSPAAIAEQVRSGIDAERDQLRADLERTDKAYSVLLEQVGELRIERDSQATIVAAYLRERDSAWAELERLNNGWGQDCGRAMDAVVVDEREACAKLAEKWMGRKKASAVDIARAIRARGGK